MLVKNHTETLSQALLNLERIRKVERPINYGILGLYGILKSPELDERLTIYLKYFKEFCESFEKIASFEQKKDFSSLEKWLFEKTEENVTSRIDSFLAIYSLFPSETERLKQVEVVRKLSITVNNILSGKRNVEEVKVALETLKTFREKMLEKFEVEKRFSEKIIGGRAPSI